MISADVPANGNLNQTIPINITFDIYNGCGGFGNITETDPANTKTINVNAKYEGCFCTQVMGEVQTTYNFISTAGGIHTIKFLQSNGDFFNLLNYHSIKKTVTNIGFA